jgi:arginase
MKDLPRRPVTVLGVPMDLGAGRRGTDMGPSAVRLAGLHRQLARAGFDDVEDLGDVEVPAVETLHDPEDNARHVDAIAKACRATARIVKSSLRRGRVPVVLGGDHSIAAGSVAGVSAHFRAKKQSIGLMWFDAHGDINTPATTLTGNVHGMPLAALLGLEPAPLARIEGTHRKVDPKRVTLIGIRDLDDGERRTLREQGCTVFTMTEIDERGIAAVMRDAVRVASGADGGPFHVSFDLDGVDPRFAPGVGTPVEGGLTYREAHYAMEIVAETRRMCSMDVVEINPVIDERNRTGKLAMELVLSALGKRIFVP